MTLFIETMLSDIFTTLSETRSTFSIILLMIVVCSSMAVATSFEYWLTSFTEVSIRPIVLITSLETASNSLTRSIICAVAWVVCCAKFLTSAATT